MERLLKTLFFLLLITPTFQQQPQFNQQQTFQQPQQNFQQQQNFNQQRPQQQQPPQQTFANFQSSQQETLPTLPPVFIPPNSPQGPPPQLQSPIRNLFREPSSNNSNNGFSISGIINRFLSIFNWATEATM